MARFEVKLVPVPGSQRPREEVFRALWGELCVFLRMYWSGAPELEEYLGTVPYFEGSGVEGEVLAWSFDTSTGLARQGEAWARIGFAATLHRIDPVVSELGWWIEAPRDELSGVFEAWREALTPGDPLLTMIEPSAEFAAALQRNLFESEDLAVLRSAAWYLENLAHPSEELIEIAVDACGGVEGEALYPSIRAALERVSGRVELVELAQNLTAGSDPMRFALGVTILSCTSGRGGLDSEAWLAVLERGAGMSEPASDVCVDLLGREHAAQPAQLGRIYAALVGVLGGEPGEETQHAAVLSLVNMFLNRASIPPGLLDIFRDQSDAPAPIGGLAQWAVAFFQERPIAALDAAADAG